MLNFYNYLFFVIYSSVKRTKAVDPVFSGIGLITYFESKMILICFVIVEIILRQSLITGYKEYFIYCAILLLILNAFYFYFKKKYSKIINDSKFLVIKSKIKTWHIIVSMFLIFVLLALVALIREYLFIVE